MGINFATFGPALASTPNVMYFRNHNMDRSVKLPLQSMATSVTLNEWNTTINNFDSPNDVYVQRIDVTGKNYSAPKTETIVWIAKGSCLQLHVTLSAEGEASMYVVTSGKVQWDTSQAMNSTCGTSRVLIG